MSALLACGPDQLCPLSVQGLVAMPRASRGPWYCDLWTMGTDTCLAWVLLSGLPDEATALRPVSLLWHWLSQH